MKDMDTPLTKADLYTFGKGLTSDLMSEFRAELSSEIRKFGDDIFQVLDTMMARIDDRFHDNERRIVKLQDDVTTLGNQVDGLEKRMEISDDERLIMAYQLTKLQNWAEQAGRRIGLTFDR